MPKWKTMTIPAKFKRFMSMFDISEETANIIYNVANVLVVLTAIAGCIGAIGLFWGGGVREHYSSLKTAEIEARAKSADAKAAVANAEAAKANERAAALEVARLQLVQEIESERKKRKELTAAIAPRILEQFYSAQSLRVFKGVNVHIVSSDDHEASDFARQLHFLLSEAEWNVLSVQESRDPAIRDGISIRSNIGPIHADDQSRAAREGLIAELRKQGVKATTGAPESESLPFNTLIIVVGRLPREFFLDEFEKKLLENNPADANK